MSRLFALLIFLIPAISFAENIDLTVEEYDYSRQRAVILVLDSSQVPLGTVLRVHSKTGTCAIQITERVNDHLVGTTRNCTAGVITAGMKLAYSPTQTWEQPAPVREPAQEVSTTYSSPDSLDILERLSVYIGHSFSSELEGNVYADGSQKDLNGDTALSLGIKGRIYDFTDRISLATELGYESPRTFDQVTNSNGSGETVGGTIGYSPRVTLWSLAVLGQAKIMDRLNGFGGINFSLPSVDNSPFKMSGDLGFQGGANYQLLPQIALEGLVKITNMNLKNNLGQTTDVSMAGFELRGRYSF